MQFSPSLSSSNLTQYVLQQLNHFFPDQYLVRYSDLHSSVEEALQRIYFSFKHIQLKYYCANGNTLFNHLNSDHYCVFLYYLSNTVYVRLKQESIASKIFLLNKALHGIDAFYSIKLPDIFMVVHPLGTILGNASYANYLVVYQNCSVGASIEDIYPTFGEKTILYSKSSILGNTICGSNVVFGSGSFVLNQTIPSFSTIVGQYPQHKIMSSNSAIFDRIFYD